MSGNISLDHVIGGFGRSWVQIYLLEHTRLPKLPELT